MTWCIGGYLPRGELCRPLYFAQQLDDAEGEVGEAYAIYSTNEARRLFGAGSIASLMVNQHFCTCPEIPVYVAPLADPAAGVKAVHTIAIEGPSTDNGVLSLAILDEVFTVGVPVGATGEMVATALAANLQRWRDLPFDVTLDNGESPGGEEPEEPDPEETARRGSRARRPTPRPAAGGGVITLTAKNAGLEGNWFQPQFNPNFGDAYPPGIGVEVATPTTGMGLIDIDPALPVMACRYDCIAIGVEDEVAVNSLVQIIRQNWACVVQGEFKDGHLFHSRTATSSQIYAYAMDRNNPEESVMPVPPDYKYPGYLFAAAAASRVCCTACYDPSRPVQRDNGVLGCLFDSGQCHTLWSSEEKKMFFDAGVVNWDLANTRGVRSTALWIEEPLTTYKYDPLTGSPDGAWQRVESRYSVAKFVRDLGDWYARYYSSTALVNDGFRIPPGKRAINPRLLQAQVIAWLSGTQLGWTAELGNVPLDRMVRVERTNQPNNCDPNRVNVLIDLDLVNQLARIATTLDVSPEFACIPPTVTASAGGVGG